MSRSGVAIIPVGAFYRENELSMFPFNSSSGNASLQTPEIHYSPTKTSKVSYALIAYVLLQRYYTGSSVVFFGLIKDDDHLSNVADFTLHKDTTVFELAQMLETAMSAAYNPTALKPDAPKEKKEMEFRGFNTVVYLEKTSVGEPAALLNFSKVYEEHALMQICIFGDGTRACEIAVSAKNTSTASGSQMLWQMCKVIELLEKAGPDTTIKDFNQHLYTPSQIRLFRKRAAQMPEPATFCLHELVASAGAIRYSTVALSSTADNITYGKLEEYSTTLAGWLVESGVQPRTIVPLCSEKSVWVVVAMLAILKTGSAFAMLDPQHPQEILQECIIRLDATTYIHSVDAPKLSLPQTVKLVNLSKEIERLQSSGAEAEENLSNPKAIGRKLADRRRNSVVPPKEKSRNSEIVCLQTIAHGQRESAQPGELIPKPVIEVDIAQSERADHAFAMALHLAEQAGQRPLRKSTRASLQEVKIAQESAEITLNDLAYVVFTSGSTGVPKIVKISHSNIATSIKEHGPRLLLTSSTRCLQFTSFAFDPFILEIFSTLTAGGCVCVPTEGERLNALTTFMNKMSVNHALFTPSFSRLVAPEEVPTLKVLQFGGEALSEDNIKTWRNHVSMIQAYGPAECSVMCTVKQLDGYDYPQNLGFSVGCVLWIACIDDDSLLVPDGTHGELLIEGPIVGQGYHNDLEKTTASFVRGLDWLGEVTVEGNAAKCRTVYKTGDLAYFQSDGTVMFLGRRDTQVKINGQRIELGEVESQVFNSIEEFSDVAVVVSRQRNDHSTDKLAAFVVCKPKFLDAKFEMSSSQLTKIRAKINSRLPMHMCPWIYIPVAEIPTMPSRKVNRSMLMEWASTLTPSQISDYAGGAKDFRKPVSYTEQTLARIWASVLKIAIALVGADDDFFLLGGNSLKAMQMVAEIQDAGFRLTVREAFENTKLSDMAAIMKLHKGGRVALPKPFSLISGQAGLLKLIRTQCNLGSVSVIEDVFPTTPEQDRMLRETVSKPGTFGLHSVWQLGPDIDVVRLQKAWKLTAKTMQNLRTRVVEIDAENSVQVVLKEGLNWVEKDVKHLTEVGVSDFGFNKPLVSYTILNDMNGPTLFELYIHHALVDGWSVGTMWEAVKKAYIEELPVKVVLPMSALIQHFNGLDHAATDTFWRRELAGAPVSTLLAPSPAGYTPLQTTRLDIKTKVPWTYVTTKSSIIINAGFAVALSEMQAVYDVVFRTHGTGRNISLPYAHHIAGPTLDTFPIRVKVDPSQTVHGFLLDLQRSFNNRGPHEYRGLRNIRKVSDDAAAACSFDSPYLIVQNETDEDPMDGFTKMSGEWKPSRTPLSVCAFQKSYGMRMFVCFDLNLITRHKVEKLCDAMDTAIKVMVKSLEEDNGQKKMAKLFAL